MVADVGETVSKVNEVALNNFSVDQPLHAHVSDPHKVLQDGVKSVAKNSKTHGNFGEHLFKHVSNPPEAFNEDVKFVAIVVPIY